jgi:hypothetical protein
MAKGKAPPHAWKTGQSGNPSGRPIGARHLLADAFWRSLHEEWKRRGDEAMKAISDAYLSKLAIQAAPREMKLDADIKLGFAEALEQFSREYARRKGQPPGGVEGGS